MLHYTKIIFTICRIISREQRFTRYNCETLCDNGVMYISTCWSFTNLISNPVLVAS